MTREEAFKIINECLDELDWIEDIVSYEDGYCESWQSTKLSKIIKKMKEAIKKLNDGGLLGG